MSEKLQVLKKVYELYREFEEHMNSLGKGFKIPNGLAVNLDYENECLHVTEDNFEEEMDEYSFINTFVSYLDGATEAINHALSGLYSEYNKVLQCNKTEAEFIDYAGKLQLGTFKLNRIYNDIQKI